CADRQIISMPPREGAFAEFLVMPERNLVFVPDHVASPKAALAEPLACGWHAVRLAGRALPVPIAAASVLVIGGGAIGLGVALSLAVKGTEEIWIAETNEKRHATLAAAGDFRVFDPRLSGGPARYSFDLVVDAVGFAGTRAAACEMVKSGGVIVHIGLGEAAGGLDVRRMTLQEITFVGTYTYTADDFRETAAAIFDGRLGPLDWLDIRPLDGGVSAFREIHEGDATSPKIILEP
ncbi:MAG: zinc-binding dehydrogenase, partial [Alphaproteobacteria bacterium]|nr:zinc-binding dehydrogenase [Alphaproteobacteria bacterium]